MEARNGGEAGAEVVVGSSLSNMAANGGQTGKEVGGESAFAFREWVVLGRKGSTTSITLGWAGRYKVAVALNGSSKQPVVCSARLVICQSEAGSSGRREETPVMEGLQIHGKTCSASQIFDVPAIAPGASAFLEVELGPTTGFRQVDAEISVQLLPQAPQSSDSSTRRICHLRASSRHFDDSQVDLRIANEYCGGQDLSSSLLCSSLPSCLPSRISALSAAEKAGGDERQKRSERIAANNPQRTDSCSPSEQGGPGGILAWASKFRRQPKAAATLPDQQPEKSSSGRPDRANSIDEPTAAQGTAPRAVPRTWGWGRGKEAMDTGRNGGGSEMQGALRAAGFAAVLRPPQVRTPCVLRVSCVCSIVPLVCVELYAASVRTARDSRERWCQPLGPPNDIPPPMQSLPGIIRLGASGFRLQTLGFKLYALVLPFSKADHPTPSCAG